MWPNKNWDNNVKNWKTQAVRLITLQKISESPKDFMLYVTSFIRFLKRMALIDKYQLNVDFIQITFPGVTDVSHNIQKCTQNLPKRYSYIGATLKSLSFSSLVLSIPFVVIWSSLCHTVATPILQKCCLQMIYIAYVLTVL